MAGLPTGIRRSVFSGFATLWDGPQLVLDLSVEFDAGRLLPRRRQLRLPFLSQAVCSADLSSCYYHLRTVKTLRSTMVSQHFLAQIWLRCEIACWLWLGVVAVGLRRNDSCLGYDLAIWMDLGFGQVGQRHLLVAGLVVLRT